MLSKIHFSSLFDTVTLKFWQRVHTGTRPDGQPVFSWQPFEISGCLYTVDAPQTEEEAQRYHSTDRVQVSIPKGHDHIDFTGALLAVDNKVYKIEGNSMTSMSENTPGQWNRTVYGYRPPNLSYPSEVLENE